MKAANTRRPALAAAVGLLLAAALICRARVDVAVPAGTVGGLPERSPRLIFFDDMEGGPNGWTHVDNTEGRDPRFHLDDLDPCEGSYSWWCGVLDAAYSGGDGYGNGWNERLNLPPLDVGAGSSPALTFDYRIDCEPQYDMVFVEAESSGIFVPVMPALSGSSDGWATLGDDGVSLAGHDDPAVVRFRFISDGGYSDSDGLYDSNAGAFHVDNIRIFDSVSGHVYFHDDCETGGSCTPAGPAAAGDFWHLIDRASPAFSRPHSWWCGEDGDTSLVPPNLDNSLISPAADLSGCHVCTLRFLVHAEVPTVDNDYWIEEISTNGGADWYTVGVWWGDFGQTTGWAAHGIEGVDLTPYLPGSSFRFRLTVRTSENGCGPGVAGAAGVMLDDTWVEDWTASPVKPTSWGQIKSLYR